MTKSQKEYIVRILKQRKKELEEERNNFKYYDFLKSIEIEIDVIFGIVEELER